MGSFVKVLNNRWVFSSNWSNIRLHNVTCQCKIRTLSDSFAETSAQCWVQEVFNQPAMFDEFFIPLFFLSIACSVCTSGDFGILLETLVPSNSWIVASVCKQTYILASRCLFKEIIFRMSFEKRYCPLNRTFSHSSLPWTVAFSSSFFWVLSTELIPCCGVKELLYSLFFKNCKACKTKCIPDICHFFYTGKIFRE